MQKPVVITNKMQPVKKYTVSRKKLITSLVSQLKSSKFYEKAATNFRWTRSPQGTLLMKQIAPGRRKEGNILKVCNKIGEVEVQEPSPKLN